MTRKPLLGRPLSLGGSSLLGLLLVATLTACEADAEADPPIVAESSSSSEESGSSSGANASLPKGEAMIAPGTYRVPSSIWSAVDFTITFPEGWRVRKGNAFDTNGEQIDELGLSPFVVDKIYADACKGDRGAQLDVGPGVDDLVDALLAQRGPAKSTVQTTLGGYPATRVDLRIPDRLQTENCFIGPGTGAQIWLNGPKNYLYLGPDGLLSIYVVDVDGQRAVFQSQYKPAHTAAEDLAELRQVLDSIHIEK